MEEKTIGIVGGLGPYAGYYLANRILDQTKVALEQDHIPAICFSMPGQVSDRTDFLSGKVADNPADGIYNIIKKMETAGVNVAGICCNTAHAPQIYNKIIRNMERENCKIKLLHMIEEVIRFIKVYFYGIERIGILSTKAAVHAGVYSDVIKSAGLTPVVPSEDVCEMIDECIYHNHYGIKLNFNPSMDFMKEKIMKGIEHLIYHHAEAVILGCTELPLIVSEKMIQGRPVIDSSLVLARALIRETMPERLISWPDLRQERL